MRSVTTMALVTLFVVFAITGTSMADEWLVNGESLTTARSTDATGELFITVLSGNAGVTIDCTTWLYIGTVGPGGKGSITELLDLNNKAVPIKCAVANVRGGGTNVCTVGSTAEFTVQGLPWETTITLSGSEFINDYPSKTAFTIKCTFEGFAISTLCEGFIAPVLLNFSPIVAYEFSNTVGTNLVACTTGEAKIEGVMELFLNGSGVLSVS